MEESINQRIVQYLESKGKRQIDLLIAGYASKQTISNIWNEKSKPSCEFFERLINDNKDLNVRWLFTGIGDMLEKTDIATTAMVEYLEKKITEKDIEIKELNQQVGSLRAKLSGD
ncbi:hypothetical protein [Dysgonomonas macrotermitis]|uniref:Spindle pole body component Spc42p n=1 Tax=Dysgonomonas macrotermitis TaxID=1346286 RepID=A0A1M4UPV0_9BACT|nr:hypothetical protein [Dysgonomonas macrotermitis]SHE58623.1 Spindle pole body component Spc42p [Dysgonomonas macrotermitis]